MLCTGRNPDFVALQFSRLSTFVHAWRRRPHFGFRPARPSGNAHMYLIPGQLLGDRLNAPCVAPILPLTGPISGPPRVGAVSQPFSKLEKTSMSRLKLLAAAMLLALPIISACGDDVPPPPPTGSIDGLVSIEGQGQDGISVTLSNGATVTTANGGMFRFDGVEAGAYTVTISNYPDDASFNQTSAAATIATDGENVTVNFPGTWIRTAAIMGTVTVENEGLSGVTVKLSGMSDSETLTDASGQYAFTGLRAGNYTIEISGFDEEDVAFGSTQSTAALAVGESKVVTFEGTYLRASAITGQVTIEDNPLEGVMVSLQGKGEDRTATTNGAGQFTFSELRRGDYSVGITNPDADEYSFEVTSKTITIAHGETGTASFNGVLLRSATIIGTVTVENVGGIPATVTIQGGEKGQELTTTTNDAGQFRFTQLYAGDYSVGISGFDDDLYGFDVTTATITVERKTTATVKPFEGIELRTAGIEGTITVDGGHPLPGVTVTVTGGPKDEEHTRVTNDAGYYMVDELHAGVYTVAISDFDENEYEFEATTRTIDVGLRTTAEVAFQGDLLRTGGISGRVSVGGTLGLDGITVTLSGDADGEMMTADGGQYAFTGLAEGDYMVAIEGWDDDLYAFDMTEAERHVAQDASEIVNFEGTHRENNTISGMLFLDEVDPNGMHDHGEPPFAMTAEMMAALTKAGIPGVPLLLQGPGVNDVQFGAAMPDGSYAFPDLVAGSYRVLVNVTDTLANALNLFGFRFAGELTGQVANVAAGDGATVNFPFRITMQTIHVGAVMGNADTTTAVVDGVKLAMYPTAEDAEDGTNMLGMPVPTDSTGYAKFDFMRAMDHGPGGQGTDHLVFVKVADPGHADLEVSANDIIEVKYPSTARVSKAPTAVRLLNKRVHFQWMVTSDSDARGGPMPLAHWKVVMGTDTIATNAKGMAEYDGTADVDSLPVSMTVMLDSTQVDSLTTKGEMWDQSKALTYEHDGLALPLGKGDDVPSAGTIEVTWETQTLVVGVYRERDDIAGYKPHTSHRDEDDQRPNARVAGEMSVEVQTHNGRKWVEYEWDHDLNPKTDPIHPKLTVGADGLVMINHLPATEELRVELDAGQHRTVVTELEEVNTYDEDLDEGMTVGSFGDGGGGTPEVWLCTASLEKPADAKEMEDYCATFGYQWMTGTVVGAVSPATKGIDIDLVAVTDNHGADDDDGTTGTTGRFSFPGTQDGTYDLTATGNADWHVSGTPTQRVWCYHDENADEKDESKADSAWVGKACADATRTWTLKQQGLEIRGYVANVDHEYNKVVRGDETFEGAVLEIHQAGTGASKDGIPPKGKKLDQTATVDENGLYKFVDLPAGSYVITAKNTDLYEALQSNPADNVAGPAAADDDYVDVDEQNETLALPFWVYETSTAMNITDAVTVGTGRTAKNFTFHNFALLHKDGTFSGAVREASGRSGDVAVELRRCLVYTPADTMAVGPEDDVAETCSDDPAFRPQVKQSNSGGSWGFPGLREGYYQVNIAATGYNRAKWDADGINDDAMNCEGGTEADAECDTQRTMRKFDLLKGKTAFNRDRAVYYIYNGNLRADDMLTGLSVEGVTAVGAEAVEMVGDTDIDATTAQEEDGGNDVTLSANAAVTYRTGSITVKATVSAGATYKVMRGSGATAKTYTPTKNSAGVDQGATVPLLATATPAAGGPDVSAGAVVSNAITVMITGENGYNDHGYAFTATRTNPAGNALADSEITGSGDAITGSGTNASPWVITTASATTQNVTVSFGLVALGAGSTSGYCVQEVEVYTADGTKHAKATDTDADLCPGEFYSLSSGAAGGDGLRYRVEMKSEDKKTNDYYILVTRGS
ncbi:MAG: hypothetical protein F4139_00195 [Gemmatimonadetes bacterium]|nr:hypothetical protein [Gemmatimonadota bacterium]